MYELLKQTAPVLHLTDNPLPDNDTLYEWINRAVSVPAPSGGSGLPGSSGEVLEEILASSGVGSKLQHNYKGTGNTLLWLGADKTRPDIVLTSHMDRPTFRISDLNSGTLYPICSDRFPEDEHRVGAVASRFEDGKLVTGAQGTLISGPASDGGSLRFEVEAGELQWADSITLYEPIQRDGDHIIGTGFDNAIGIITLAMTAGVFAAVEADLKAKGKTLVFAFTEHEEGPPSGYFFSQGASRLAHSLEQPLIGAVNVDGHSADDNQVTIGQGASHGVISSTGRGSVAPPNFAAMAESLAQWANAIQPDSVQMNYGYISRSDDMALHRWSRVIGLAGIPLKDAHTAHESAHLTDLVACSQWLVHFLVAALGYVPTISETYLLHR
ncbi:MAG: M20/M25/M40 family metallo-hydrolase [Chloroflexota bacterium]